VVWNGIQLVFKITIDVEWCSRIVPLGMQGTISFQLGIKEYIDIN